MKNFKILLLILISSNICFAACVDMGIMQGTAEIVKRIYETADKVVEQIIKEIHNDDDDISQDNSDSADFLRYTQNLDSSSTFNAQQVFFNQTMINELESVLLDSKAESMNFNISKELEEILK